MQKTILFLLLGVCTVYGMQYERFLQKALRASAYINTAELSIQEARYQKDKTIRYKNPSLELEYARYDSEPAHRVSITQPVRLWGVSEIRKNIGKSIEKSAQNKKMLTRAEFVKKLNLFYIEYKKSSALLRLASQESAIAQKIYNTAQERFQNGTIAKADVVQAELDYRKVQAKEQQAFLQRIRNYYALLEFAGVKEEIELEDTYTFFLIHKSSSNPLLEYMKSRQKLAQHNAELYDNALEWVNMYVEYEAEPDVDIYRFGVNIPIALFNTRKEERKIAMLQVDSQSLLIQNERNILSLEAKRLQKEYETLQKALKSYTEALEKGNELLELFQEGFRIASIDIVQIQQVKSTLIETQKELIEVRSTLEKNIVRQNFIKGNYNE